MLVDLDLGLAADAVEVLKVEGWRESVCLCVCVCFSGLFLSAALSMGKDSVCGAGCYLSATLVLLVRSRRTGFAFH